MRSIFGRIVDMSESQGRAWFMRASGWKGTKAPQRFTGYHKQMPRAEMKALALRLQRGAR